jgi:hypothetical protein
MPVLESAFQLAPTLPRARECPRDAVFGDDLYQACAASLAVSPEACVQVMGEAEIVPGVFVCCVKVNEVDHQKPNALSLRDTKRFRPTTR